MTRLFSVLLLLQYQQAVGLSIADTLSPNPKLFGITRETTARELFDTTASLWLRSKQNQTRIGVSVAHTDTVRNSAGQHVFWGTLIGGAVGLTVGVISKNHSTDCQDCIPSADAIPFVGAALGALAGALTGFVVWVPRRP